MGLSASFGAVGLLAARRDVGVGCLCRLAGAAAALSGFRRTGLARVERGLGGVPALAAAFAPEGRAVLEHRVDLPPLAAGGARDPELVLPGVTAGRVPFLDGGQARL